MAWVLPAIQLRRGLFLAIEQPASLEQSNIHSSLTRLRDAVAPPDPESGFLEPESCRLASLRPSAVSSGTSTSFRSCIYHGSLLKPTSSHISPLPPSPTCPRPSLSSAGVRNDTGRLRDTTLQYAIVISPGCGQTSQALQPPSSRTATATPPAPLPTIATRTRSSVELAAALSPAWQASIFTYFQLSFAT